MEKETNGEVVALFAEHLGNELELVVVDPNDRIRLRSRGKRIGEALINGDVSIPLVAVVGRLA